MGEIETTRICATRKIPVERLDWGKLRVTCCYCIAIKPNRQGHACGQPRYPRLGYCIGGKGRADGPEIRPGCLPLSSSDQDQTDNRRNVFTLKSMLPGVSLRTVFKVIMPLFTADITVLREIFFRGIALFLPSILS